MAEFPDLGEHCAFSECKRLDYLPMRCKACKASYCKEHLQYEEHNCPEAYAKMNEHINQNCEIKKAEKMFKNSCTKPGCKKRELLPITCSDCEENFCLSHRHPKDHNCIGNNPRSKAASAALTRNMDKMSIRQNQISMDADLARAIQLSQEEEDRQLAQRLQAEINSGPSNNSSDSRCIVC